MTTARRLLLAGGGTGSFGPTGPFEATILASPQGGWPSVHASAIYYNGYVYIGYVNSSGDIKVGIYNETTGATTQSTLHAALEADWHNEPSLAVRSDGSLVAFYSAHAGAAMYQRVSINSLDTDPTITGGWGSEANRDGYLGGSQYTYPALYSVGSTLWLFYRDGTPTSANWCYSKSTDGGSVWTAQQALFHEGGAYWHVSFDGDDRFDFVCADESSAVGLYHFYMLASTGARYTTAGASIGAALPIGVASMTAVGSGTNAAPLAVIANGGFPVISFPSYTVGGTLTQKWATWDGATWNVRTMASHALAAEAWVYGGVAIESATVAYVSLDAGGHFDVWRYRTTDSGITWSTAQISSSPSDDFYPVAVTDPHRLRAVWLRGTATDYTVYTLATIGAVL